MNNFDNFRGFLKRHVLYICGKQMWFLILALRYNKHHGPWYTDVSRDEEMGRSTNLAVLTYPYVIFICTNELKNIYRDSHSDFSTRCPMDTFLAPWFLV